MSDHVLVASTLKTIPEVKCSIEAFCIENKASCNFGYTQPVGEWIVNNAINLDAGKPPWQDTRSMQERLSAANKIMERINNSDFTEYSLCSLIQAADWALFVFMDIESYPNQVYIVSLSSPKEYSLSDICGEHDLTSCQNMSRKLLDAINELAANPISSTVSRAPESSTGPISPTVSGVSADTNEATPQQTKTAHNPDFEWKTSIGFSLLGAVASIVVNFLPLGGIFGTTVTVGYWVIAFFYVVTVYPSLFKEYPKLTSSRGISFCNMFFGGVAFGALFNTCLTKRKKGISYIVYTILMIISALLGLTFFLFWGGAYANPLDKINNGTVENDCCTLPIRYSYNSLESEVTTALCDLGVESSTAKSIFLDAYRGHWESANGTYYSSLENGSLANKHEFNYSYPVADLRTNRGANGIKTNPNIAIKTHLNRHSGSHTDYCESYFQAEHRDFLLTIFTGCKHTSKGYGTAYYAAIIENA